MKEELSYEEKLAVLWDIKERFSENIYKNNQLPRKHATFYNSHDTKVKERGIVNLFFSKNNREVELEYCSSDPPDVVAIEHDSKKIAIEVTELVSEEAIKKQINGKSKEYLTEILSWNKEKVVDNIDKIIVRKNELFSKCFGQYDSSMLLIHTDEIDIQFEKLYEYLETYNCPKNSFNEIFLFTSYDPRMRKYHTYQLK